MAQKSDVEIIGKLPVAARHLITKLQADVAHWRRIAEARLGEGPTDTYLWGGVCGEDVPLPARARVRYVTVAGAMTVRNHGTDIEVMGDGGERLVVYSVASNVIRVGLTRHDL